MGDGEARKRRSADEAPAATVALAHPYAYAGYAHPGYAYPGYAHAGYAYPYVAPKVLEPKTVEIEVPTPVLKEVEVKVPVSQLAKIILASLFLACKFSSLLYNKLDF